MQQWSLFIITLLVVANELDSSQKAGSFHSSPHLEGVMEWVPSCILLFLFVCHMYLAAHQGGASMLVHVCCPLQHM
jgi:hypothetical protein